MSKIRLTNAMRAEIVRRLVEHHARPREIALRARENALALKMLRTRYGDDVFERCRGLPDGWLTTFKHLGLDYAYRQAFPRTERQVHYGARGKEQFYWVEKKSIDLVEYAPLPTSAKEGWNLEVLNQRLSDEIHDLCTALHALEEERQSVKVRLTAALVGYFTVEALADGWPEGYAFFPQDMLTISVSGYSVPAPRPEDLNAALAALAQAA